MVVTSDIGGDDPDDFQSFVHLLLYANHFDIEGLVSSPIPKDGRAEGSKAAFLEVIDAYENDFRKLSRFSTPGHAYPSPVALRRVVAQGQRANSKNDSLTSSSAGAERILAAARKKDSRPLYVICWGGMRDVAIALKRDPSIVDKLRVYSIASWNRNMDPKPYDYINDNHKRLWWIISETTFRGMYADGARDLPSDLKNDSFVERHVKGHGSLGRSFYNKKRVIKMGDSPSFLWLLDCPTGPSGEKDPEDPSWGGQYLRHSSGRRLWVDRYSSDAASQKTVARWRIHYLRHWQTRMDRVQ
jgi:hypothetical protein